jgi:predicted transcriptional regulator
LALAQGVDTETVAAAAIGAGLRGPAIGQAVARARAQALVDAQLPSAIEAH